MVKGNTDGQNGTEQPDITIQVGSRIGLQHMVRGWRRPEQDEELQGPPSDEATFDELIGEIALLDETYQERGLNVEQYQAHRQELMQKARRLSEIEVMK